MILQTGLELENSTVSRYLIRLTNQIYKMLPSREEDANWEWQLSIIIEEIRGAKRVFNEYQEQFLILLCKLEGMYSLTEEKDFLLYRRTIFECLSIIKEVAANVNR